MSIHIWRGKHLTQWDIMRPVFVPKLIVPIWKTIKPAHSFEKFIFPSINRVFPTLLENELISVQPMTMPCAQIFYMDFKTTSTPNENECLPTFDQTETIKGVNLECADDEIWDWLNQKE